MLLSVLLTGPEDPGMSTKFSEDVIPLTDLKVNPGRVVKHATDAHRPVLLTSRGRGVAVVQSVNDYEAAEEERAFMRAVVTGLADLDVPRDRIVLICPVCKERVVWRFGTPPYRSVFDPIASS